MNRKLLTVLLLCVISLGLYAGSGDVNGDGKINAADIVELVNYLNGNPSGNFIEDAADVNEDGYIDRKDVDAIANKIMGEESLINISIHELSITDSSVCQEFEFVIQSDSENALENIKWQLSDDCKEWLGLNAHNGGEVEVSGNGYSLMFKVVIPPNVQSLERKGKIFFTNDACNFKDSVLVHTKSYIKLLKKEYHVANQEDRQIIIEYESNLPYEVLGECSTELISADCDWLHLSGASFNYDLNETGKTKEALIKIKNDKLNFCDTLKVISYSAEIPYKAYSFMLACQPSGGIVEIPVVGSIENLPINISHYGWLYDSYELPEYLHLQPNVIRKDTLFVSIKVDANTGDEDRYTEFKLHLGDGSGIYFLFVQPGNMAPSFKDQKAALRDLYDSLNGEKWTRKDNWFSNKPITEWYGINDNSYYKVIGDYVVTLNLFGNNLNGELPESFSNLMPYCTAMSRYYHGNYLGWAFDMEDNHIYGKIPASVKNHPAWNIIGWSLIKQMPSQEEYFNYGDFNLRVENKNLELMVEEENGPQNVYDIISNNELTLVHHAGDVCPNWSFFAGISDKQVNQYLDYCHKGLGMAVVTSRYFDSPFEPFVDYVLDRQKKGMPKDIHWLKDSIGNIIPNCVGTKYLLDKEGNLVQIFRGSCSSEDYCLPRIDSVCRERLGSPEEHPIYTSIYTSTDYSRDGEVTVLQEATQGTGIDLVFVGEAYVDTMVANGVYDKAMHDAMEQFFSEEPYKSLRDRFNIYAVKAISPNDSYIDGVTTLAIGGNHQKAFEYAQKAVGDRNDRLMVAVICRLGAIPERSCTFMFEGDGSFVSYIFTGPVGTIVNHEVGGHGIAYLLDEYVEDGWEESSPDDDRKAAFDELYKQYEEGANIDWRSDPTQVRWNRFINDTRYANEQIGVYEGAGLYGHGMYRPTENSMMRYNDCGFNAPSREAIYKRVMKLSEGDDWTYDYETFVDFDAPARQAYSTASSRRAQVQKAPMRRIVSRPPTFYKGTWQSGRK